LIRNWLWPVGECGQIAFWVGAILVRLGDHGIYTFLDPDSVHNTQVKALLLRCIEGEHSYVAIGIFIGIDILGFLGRGRNTLSYYQR
jgi:hypothetical protein